MKARLDCKDVARLISDGQDLALPSAVRARMRLHFVMCETCRNIHDQMGFLRRAMRKLDQSQETDEPPGR